MAGTFAHFPGGPGTSLLAAGPLAAAAGQVLAPAVIIVLCVVAGVGTALLLPSRREAALRKIGGTILGVAGLILVALLIRYTGSLNTGGMSLYFWIFAAIAVVGAVRVVTHPRPVYSALYFVLSVMATAGLFILLWAEFMAAALVIIYAGAILVTYVFVIMLASQPSGAPSTGDPRGGVNPMADYDAVSREPVIASAIGFTLMGVLLFVIFDKAGAASVPVKVAGTVPTGVAATQPAGVVQTGAVQTGAGQQAISPGSPRDLGEYLFRNQLVNLELAGVILTLGMVGAILIARRRVLIAQPTGAATEIRVGPGTPVDDNPHSIPVYGTDNPRAKAYPET